MSVYRGRPEVTGGQNDAIDPTETLAAPKGGNASAIRTCAENSLPRRDGAIQSAPQEKQSHDDRKNAEPKESRTRRLMVNVGYLQHKHYQENQRVRHPLKR